MKQKKSYGIGLLGFGTIGTGVIKALRRHGDLIEQRTGLRLELRAVADIDLERDRGVEVDRGIMTTDGNELIADPQVDVVVELIGGIGAARDLILKSLAMGKPVVTANKALLAEYGAEIFAAAEEGGADLFYEASVGGGIPIIRALREGLIANRIEKICGILNGTCNFILTEMERRGESFAKVLADAQAAGYAEADPALDVDGIDTAHKAAILASLAYGFPVRLGDIYVEGIGGIEGMDIEFAAGLGYRIKLLAVIAGGGEEVEVRVHPALVPRETMLGSVSGVYNAVLVRGDIVGETLYYGRGAGSLPTASAVLSDLTDVARNLASSSPRRVPAFVQHQARGRVRSMDEVVTRYYLRAALPDRPGMLARVAQILGRHQISIASVVQKEGRTGEHVPVIILTHEAAEKNMVRALQEIDALEVVGAPTVRIRIEDVS